MILLYTCVCTHTHTRALRLLQDIEQSSLCYSQGSCWLPILSVCVYLFIGMGAVRGEVSCAVVKLGLRPLAESDLTTLLSALM